VALTDEMRDRLSDLAAAAAWLEAESIRLELDADVFDIADALRGANTTVWRAINKVESDRVTVWYDTHQMIRAMAESQGVDSLVDFWSLLCENGVLKVQVKPLIKLARVMGVDPKAHLTFELNETDKEKE